MYIILFLINNCLKYAIGSFFFIAHCGISHLIVDVSIIYLKHQICHSLVFQKSTKGNIIIRMGLLACE